LMVYTSSIPLYILLHKKRSKLLYYRTTAILVRGKVEIFLPTGFKRKNTTCTLTMNKET